jgi:glycosyltransferase involved in cell wall biosynthesis
MQFLGYKDILANEEIDNRYINRFLSKRINITSKLDVYYVFSYGKKSSFLFSTKSDFTPIDISLVEIVSNDQINQYLSENKYFICSETLIYEDIFKYPSRNIRNLDQEINNLKNSSLKKINISITSLGEIIYEGSFEYDRNEIIFYLSHFYQGKNNKTFVATIKYFGNVGVTGYANACRQLTKSLRDIGKEYIFEPICKREPILEDVPNLSRYSTYTDYSIAIFHEVPSQYLYSRIIKEKDKGKKTVLITIWETLNVPQDWKKCISAVDIVLYPSNWNLNCFKEFNSSTFYLPHPVEEIELSDLNSSSYTFYTINEWTNRKHIDDIIESYIKEFDSSEDVRLIIKTSSITNEDIIKIIQKYSLTPPPIEIITKNLTEKEINELHDQGHVFISLSGSEGMGYGLCDSAMRGKVIITTSFGAQLEYIKGIWVVSTVLENCSYCDKRSSFHSSCEKKCLINSNYSDKDVWGRVVIDDVRRTMRYLYEKNIRRDITARDYLIRHYNSKCIGKKFIDYLDMLN